MSKIFRNGIACTVHDAHDILTGETFQRGYGAFERLRTYHGVPFKLEDHLRRLESSCKGLHLPLPISLEKLSKHIVDELPDTDCGVRIYVTSRMDTKAGDIFTLFEPLPSLSKEKYTSGIHAITLKKQRDLPEYKSTNYTLMMHALRSTPFMDAEEVIYLDEKGYVLEGGTSNIFGVVNGQLMTTKTRVLPGITRDCLLDVLHDNVACTPFRVEQLEECFLTSSIREVMPITKIDGKPVGEGVVGPITKKSMEQMQDIISKEVKIILKKNKV